MIKNYLRELVRAIRRNRRSAADGKRYQMEAQSRKSGSLAFSHGYPRPFSVIVEVCAKLDWAIIRAKKKASALTIFWPLTEDVYPPQPSNWINSRCTDINKDTVSKIFESTFGYGYEINPRSHIGKYVRKSLVNGRHDGTIFETTSDPIPGYFYQRLINNVVGDEVEEIRLIVIGGVLDICYLKRHSMENRFLIPSTSVKVLDTSSLVSDEEVRCVSRMCDEIGLEYGEIDALRDFDDGKLYIIDVNRTPAGPPRIFDKEQADYVVGIMAEAFKSSFLKEACI